MDYADSMIFFSPILSRFGLFLFPRAQSHSDSESKSEPEIEKNQYSYCRAYLNFQSMLRISRLRAKQSDGCRVG